MVNRIPLPPTVPDDRPLACRIVDPRPSFATLLAPAWATSVLHRSVESIHGHKRSFAILPKSGHSCSRKGSVLGYPEPMPLGRTGDKRHFPVERQGS